MSKYSIIRNADDLKAGDHVSWPTEVLSGLLQHHSIIEAPTAGRVGENNFRIIHVTEYDPYRDVRQASCPSSGSGGSNLYFVHEEVVDIADVIGKGKLRRYKYSPSECNEPAEVIANARSRTGRYDFRILDNNCEHFARWCKTGNRKSYQAEKAKKVLSSGMSGSSFSSSSTYNWK